MTNLPQESTAFERDFVDQWYIFEPPLKEVEFTSVYLKAPNKVKNTKISNWGNSTESIIFKFKKHYGDQMWDLDDVSFDVYITKNLKILLKLIKLFRDYGNQISYDLSSDDLFPALKEKGFVHKTLPNPLISVTKDKYTDDLFPALKEEGFAHKALPNPVITVTKNGESQVVELFLNWSYKIGDKHHPNTELTFPYHTPQSDLDIE